VKVTLLSVQYRARLTLVPPNNALPSSRAYSM